MSPADVAAVFCFHYYFFLNQVQHQYSVYKISDNYMAANRLYLTKKYQFKDHGISQLH